MPRDAVASAGTVTITSENSSLSSGDGVADLAGDFVALTVSDDGHGMSPEVLGKVFDPFFTTKPQGRGTGLGLSQVYGFARQTGGAATIESQATIGTKVTIWLPRAGKFVQTPAAGIACTSDRISARVLVVEDNVDLIEVTSAIVAQLGYEIRPAANAEEALSLLSQENFDLVFTDIMMPGILDGLGLARAIGKTAPNVPVILASGSFKHVEEAGRQYAAIQKPYRPEDLDQLVQKVLREHRAKTEATKLVDLQSVRQQRNIDRSTQ